MPPPAHQTHADSLIELLSAQCADLETLLGLARAESHAAAANDFDAVMRAVEGRAALGDRLEIYHRQIAEVRSRLNDAAFDAGHEIVRTTLQLAAEIQLHDERSRPLLLHAKADAAHQLTQINSSRRTIDAYAPERRQAVSIACDRLA